MLEGRRIVVTGGSSGIGRGLVRAYADAGAWVLAVARSERGLVAATEGLRPGRASPVAADLTTDAGRGAVATAVDHAGGRLDVVVHAAGALGPIGTPLERYPADEWYRVFEANVSAPQFLHRRLAGFLSRSAAPTVIGVSSTVGRRGRGGWGMYAVSKFALEGWLEVLGDEFAGRVYSVNPGGTRTPMRAEARPDEDPETLPTPEDIAPLFLRLAHSACPEPSGAKLEARDWIGRDPWQGIRDSDIETGSAR
jgi:NAD(P)-dependent dehydrogenase (short-subunit alcohol dehydrogenase family)